MNRRIVQTISLILFNSSWGPEAKWICTPVLNCHACALSWFACPIGVLVHYSGYRIFPFLAAGTIVLVGVLLGRLLCGWVCPFGFLQDLLHKIKTPKVRLPEWTRYIKYVVLVGTVFVIPFLLGAETMYSFCRFCPAAAIQATIPALILRQVAGITLIRGIKLALLLAVLIGAVFSQRSFCRTLCPIGALLAVFNRFSFLRVKPPTENCISCRRCDKACPVEIRPSERILKHIPPSRHLDCVVCHDCRPVCPVPGKTPKTALEDTAPETA